SRQVLNDHRTSRTVRDWEITECKRNAPTGKRLTGQELARWDSYNRPMTRAAERGKRTAALVTLPVLPIAWFVALQEQPPWMPAAYLGYLLLVIVVPGTMFWRRLTGGAGWLSADVILGTAFGLAVEALIYPIGMLFKMPFAA